MFLLLKKHPHLAREYLHYMTGFWLVLHGHGLKVASVFERFYVDVLGISNFEDSKKSLWK